MPAPETPTAPAPAASESAVSLPIDTIGSPESSPDTLDFFSSIEKRFEDASKPADKPAPETKTENKATDKPAEAETRPASPKAKDFDIIKTQRDEARTQLEQMQSTLKELQDKLSAAEAGTSEVPVLRDKLTNYEREIAAVRVEASPEYAKVVTEPANRIRTEADRLATKYKIDRSKLIDAFAEDDQSVQADLASDLAATMNQRDQFQLYQLIDDFNAVTAKRSELQSRAQEVWQEIQQNRDKEQSAAKESAKKIWKDAEAKVWAAIEKKIPSVSTVPAVQSLRNQVAARQITELSTEEQAYSSMAGLLLPHIVKQASAAEAKIRELETSLAKFAQATPGAGGGAPSGSPEGSEDPSAGGFLERIERKFAGAA